MAGRQLDFPKTSGCNLKEQLVRRTLHNVRSQGHTYIELREDGKRLVFFCTLCHSPCYSDSVLFNHLKGSLHTEMVAAAKATLLKANPWPFNDGVLFFDDPEEDKRSPIVNVGQSKVVDTSLIDESSLAIVEYDENLRRNEDEYCPMDGEFIGDEESDNLVIPGVLCKDEVSDLEVNHIGIGQIAVRLSVLDIDSKRIRKIWCEWLGKKDSDDTDASMVPDHDFAVVTFPYNYNLGRKALLDDRFLLPSSPYSESEETGCAGKRKRKSFSDPEDISESLSNHYDSSGEESQSTNSSNMKLILGTRDDQLVNSRIISSKTMRRELRKQQRVASERMCDICQQKMLPGKDVATLLSRKSGKFVCSSRNLTGAFHVFHVSCLIHWILLCELETYDKPVVEPKVETKAKRRSKRKTPAKRSAKGKKDEIKAAKRIYSVFCPECQGTGINIEEGDELEKPTVSLSEMFRYKIKLSDARKAWMKNPEVLHNCSTGFDLPPEHDDLFQEYVSPLKLLHFYRANVSS
ncbi:putative thioredoxin M-type, chloroplastic-like [Capsicum annuum]|uniref:C2H2-type domain-containing protein n=1 Tax=Capsicum annuum TaxID=4072 RepID=A0A1U8ECY1_CAPAN|nr:uncharacterized protein LOC107845332 [Capsicum annuum]KAF3625025.1 putative thioredoxin M-type, chloroplastic-like [Capsicum annuum]KAF3650204.1 putative thioredoxin M-type, chloroplastic-like [Capsicum annuum]PHT69786.1 hypothetical protein T459_24890 [Capsicum annuum]